MGDPKIQSANHLSYLLIPNDHKLHQLLKQLGIRKITKIPKGLDKEERSIITRGSVEQAGLPFEFFQAFGRLTKSKEDPQNSTAVKLLAKKPRPTGKRKNNREQPEKIRLLKSVRIKNRSRSKRPEKQKQLDAELDKHETVALKEALKLLGVKEGQKVSILKAISIQDLDLAKKRIKDLSANQCWLSPKSMRIALFGSINDELQPQVIWRDIAGIPKIRKTTKAPEFKCSYLPSMDPLTLGLYFRPKKMPPKVKRASASAVIINGGSGVAALYPKYLITARHVLEDIKEENGKETTTLKLKIGHTRTSVKAEVIKVRGMDAIKQPDLVVLYVPDLPKKLRPLDFSDKLQVVTEPRRRKKIAHKPKRIFIIGRPNQKSPKDLLVTHGEIDGSNVSRDQFINITAPVLPGTSGGPVVDQDGKIIGFVVKMKYRTSSWDLIPKFEIDGINDKIAKITGTKIYPVAVWGPNIKKAIEEHRDSIKKGS